MDRFSTLTGSLPIFLPTPGLVRDLSVRRALLRDPAVTPVLEAWDRLTIALIGIGSVEPSPLLERSGNARRCPGGSASREARAKFAAVRAALRGGWLTTLITDLETARRLLGDDG